MIISSDEIIHNEYDYEYGYFIDIDIYNNNHNINLNNKKKSIIKNDLNIYEKKQVGKNIFCFNTVCFISFSIFIAKLFINGLKGYNVKK